MAILAANGWDLAHGAWHIVLAGLALLLALAASGHAVLYKRDSRSAIAWVGFIWLVPLAGAALYFILGVNRIRRQAVLLRRDLARYRAHETQAACSPEELHRHLPGHTGHLNMLARVVGGVVERPLLPGNRIEPLLNGDEAFPAMLEAIRAGPPDRLLLHLHLRPGRNRAGLRAGAGRRRPPRRGGPGAD